MVKIKKKKQGGNCSCSLRSTVRSFLFGGLCVSVGWAWIRIWNLEFLGTSFDDRHYAILSRSVKTAGNDGVDDIASAAANDDDDEGSVEQDRTTETKDLDSLEKGNQKGKKKYYHVVFSTGCSAFQDWQSYVFFHRVLLSGQEGHVTRVASCKDDDDVALLRREHERLIQQSMSRDRFHLHITPEYSKILPDKKAYRFFNKPFGIRHWMEQGLGFSDEDDAKGHEHDEAIFILFDPDHFIFRPMGWDYRDEPHLWVKNSHNENGKGFTYTVEDGHPMAQLYAFGGQWTRKINISAIVDYTRKHDLNRTKQTPYEFVDLKWTPPQVAASYAAGPPYVATGRDMYRIVKAWADFMVPVYLQTENHLSEMWAYSTAAAYLKLPHQLSKSFMVSNTGIVNNEGWRVLDDYKLGQICPKDNDETETTIQKDNSKFIPMPNVMHYCQRYFLGPWFFSKYHLPRDFLTCEHPLMALPDIVTNKDGSRGRWDALPDMYNITVTPDGKRHEMNPYRRRLEAMSLCLTLPALNEASLHYKHHFCKDNPSTNLNLTYSFHKNKK